VRVRNPLELAQQIFDIDRGKAAPDVKRLVRKGPMTNQFTLDKPIPVHVAYFTVWVGADGEPDYYKDYYGHQQRITLALAGKWDQIDVGEDHLTAIDASKLKEIRIGTGADSKKRVRDGSEDHYDAPMGLGSSAFGSVKYRSSDDSVGDIIRRSLGF
jgi:hypothetical protein